MAVEDPEIQGEGGASESVRPVAHPIEERLERLEQLLDPGSFVELDMLARHRAHGFGIEANRPLTDGVVTGWGTVNGRKVFVFAQDFTLFGGALGEVDAAKIHKVMDLAESVGAPVV